MMLSSRFGLLTLPSLLLFTACVSPWTESSRYKPQRAPGQAVEETAGNSGYKTIIAGDDRYNVEFTVQKKNDVRDAAIWGLYRCAEIALQEGSPYFVLQRGRIDGSGYEYVLKGAKPYKPEAMAPTGIKGGTASYLFKIFKDKAQAEAFRKDPSVTHRVVYESQAVADRLKPFAEKQP